MRVRAYISQSVESRIVLDSLAKSTDSCVVLSSRANESQGVRDQSVTKTDVAPSSQMSLPSPPKEAACEAVSGSGRRDRGVFE